MATVSVSRVAIHCVAVTPGSPIRLIWSAQARLRFVFFGQSFLLNLRSLKAKERKSGTGVFVSVSFCHVLRFHWVAAIFEFPRNVRKYLKES
jgi:hypothetical protein